MDDQNVQFTAIRGVDIIKFWYKNRIRIILFTALMSVIAIVGSLLIPNEFRSSATVFTANTPAIGIDMLSRSSNLGGLAGSLLRTRTGAFDRFLVLLESQAVNKKVIDHFDLIKVYDVADSEYPMIDAGKILQSKTNFEAFEEGYLLIEVWDEDAQRAKEMADFYVDLVNNYNIELATMEATRFREYIETKYLETMAQVDSLQERTMDFQKKFGVIEFQSQAAEYMSAIAMNTALVMESEIKLKMIGDMTNEDNPMYQRQLKEVQVLRESLDKLYNNANPNDIILNYSDLPEISTGYVRLLGEAEVLSELLKYLVPIYENARMEETKAIPGLVVVDAPSVAERKDRPKRSLIVIGVFFSSIFLILVYYSMRLLVHRNRAFIDHIKA
jgi:tyrosine-protein kinase Etk/Wzc